MFTNNNNTANDVQVTTSFPQNKSDIQKLLNNNNKKRMITSVESILKEETSEPAVGYSPIVENAVQPIESNKPQNGSKKSQTILPVLNPEFNLREIVKNSILLEDHLNHPGKQCGDCIIKHMLALESYADEMLSLNPQSNVIDYEYLKTLPPIFRRIQEEWYTSSKSLTEIAQELRQIRKKLMFVSFPVVFDNKERKCQTCSL